MLRIDDIRFSIGGQLLFDGASARIPAGHKVGLVGRNGVGKTTLFGLITGALEPQSGAITLARGARVGTVEQEAPAGPETLLQTVLSADRERAALIAEADSATDPARIATVQARLSEISAWSGEARAATILAGLGFDQAAQARPTAEFSGGWRMRVALAGVLFAAPDVLLLDEPTNYLDLEGAMWLETYLAGYPGTVLVISHDRGLLNRSAGAILHLAHRRLTLFGGNFDAFDRVRRERAAQAESAAQKQAAKVAHMQAYVDRFRYQASKARQAQSRLKMIERMRPVATERDENELRFTLPQPEPLSPPILRIEGGAAGYGEKAVLSRLDMRIDQEDRIALLGANGEGKSTLSKVLANKLQLMSGRRVAARKLRVGYFAQHQVEELALTETPIDHVRRLRPDETPAKLRARLAGFGLGADQAGLRVGKLSGGQKSRLALLLAVIDAPHLLVLDEPTNHLDIESRESLVAALGEYGGAVVLVSHDPHLVALTADRLWLVRGGRVEEFPGDVEDYRARLLAERGARPTARAAAAPPRPNASDRRRRLAPLKADLARCESRVGALEEMIARIDARLAEPVLYGEGGGERLAALHKKRSEASAAMARAEGLWEQAAARLEDAERH